MDRNEFLVRLASIVTTLDETNGSPESMLYVFCDMDMHAYQQIRDALVRGGLAVIRGHYVTLTDEGRKTARELEAAIAKRRNATAN